MTPACINCIHFHPTYMECRNPDSPHYNHQMKLGKHCQHWEHEAEYKGEWESWARRATHSGH